MISDAIILTGGKGRKLWPYSEWQPKTCLPLANKPIICRQVEQLRSLGIKNILIVSDGNLTAEKFVLREYSECEYMQTPAGGAALAIEKAVMHYNIKEYVLLYGDIYTATKNIAAVISSWLEKQKPTVLVKECDSYHRVSDGLAVNITAGKVSGFWGHPRAHYARYVVGGVFVLTEDMQKYFRHNPGYMRRLAVGGMPSKELLLEQSLQMVIEDGGEILAIESKGEFMDINYPWQLVQANKLAALVDHNVERLDATVDIADSAFVQGNVLAGNNCRIGHGVIIKGDVILASDSCIDYGAIIEENVTIGSNTVITDRALVRAGSIIGNGVKLGYNVEFSGIAYDNCSLVHNCEFYGVVGMNCDIAAGTLTGSLRFDDQAISLKVNGVWQTPPEHSSMVYLGDYCRTGVGTMFMPGVRVGHSSCIGPGVIVDRDVRSGSLLTMEQQKVTRQWGAEKYGW